MPSKKLRENSLFIVFSIIGGCIDSLGKSVMLIGKNILGKHTGPLKENTFLDMMNFSLHIGPKSFWKAPSWLKIGRSIGTLLHYVFKKEVFTEKGHK